MGLETRFQSLYESRLAVVFTLVAPKARDGATRPNGQPTLLPTFRLASTSCFGAPQVDQCAVPGQERGWGDGEDLGPPGPRNQGGEVGEPGPVRPFIAVAGDLSAQHCILVPRHQNLRHHCAIAACRRPEHTEHPVIKQIGHTQ